VTAALVLYALSAGIAGATADEILARADAAWHIVQEGRLRIRATVATEAEPPVVTNLDVYVRGAGDVLCVFRDGKQEGRKILVVGEKVWLLVPGAKHAIPISPSQRLLGGASVADVARLSFAKTFEGKVLPDEPIDGVVELARKSTTSPYASGTLWVGRDDGLPRRARLALRSGKAAKEIRFVAPRRIEIRHLLRAEHGAVTTLELSEIEERRLPPDLFDPSGAAEVR
jgi:outer membrane lipoprotein-sorting protein